MSIGVIGGPDWVEINNLLSTHGISAEYDTGFVNTTNHYINLRVRAGLYDENGPALWVNALKLYNLDNPTLVTATVNPPYTLITTPANTDDAFADIWVQLAPASS